MDIALCDNVVTSLRVAQVEPLTNTRALNGPFDYLLADDQPDVEVGSLLLVPFARRQVMAVVTAVTDQSGFPTEKLSTPEQIFELTINPKLVQLARIVAEHYCSTFARCLALVTPPGVGTGKVRKRLRTEPRKSATSNDPLVQVGGGKAGIDQLNGDQTEVLEVLIQTLETKQFAEFLLAGVTGSGKTEVYLRSVKHCLEQGQTAIVLVPEIALTPQTVGRFQQMFGDQIAVIHSGQTPAQRYDQWLRLDSGQAKICIGPRSALFAPLKNLGLIIVDEEHDTSYKSESDPRYDARTVAHMRAELEDATVIYGSATPRPESWQRLKHLYLPNRADGSPMPKVELLDMRSIGSVLHPSSVRALTEVRERQEKAIILLNRRGWSNFFALSDLRAGLAVPKL